jgi:hypothetical protein
MPPPVHWTPGDRRSIGAGVVVVDVRRISAACSLRHTVARLSAVSFGVVVVVAVDGVGKTWSRSGLRDKEESAKSLLAVLHRHLGWADGRAPLRHGIPDPVVIIG